MAGYKLSSGDRALTSESLRNLPPAELKELKNVCIENPGKGRQDNLHPCVFHLWEHVFLDQKKTCLP